MSVRPYQRIDETVRKGEPFDIHLWVIKECDGCGFTQRFAAGPANKHNVEQKMQSEYYCRDCRGKQQQNQQNLDETFVKG